MGGELAAVGRGERKGEMFGAGYCDGCEGLVIVAGGVGDVGHYEVSLFSVLEGECLNDGRFALIWWCSGG